MPRLHLRRFWPSLLGLGAAPRPGLSSSSIPPAPVGIVPAVTGATSQVERERLRRSLRASSLEGVFGEVVIACAGAAVLTGWALHLGCDPLLVGILGSLPFLAQILQLPASFLSAWIGFRRLTLWAITLARQAYLPLVVLPFLSLAQGSQQAILLAVAAVAATLGVVGNNAWVQWMAELVPDRVRGRYFGQRTALCALGATVSGLGAGLLLDWARRHGVEEHALSALALVACLAGWIGTWLYSRQHEPSSQPRPTPTLGSLLDPLRDRAARAFLGYQIAWNAAVAPCAVFYAMYMLQDLGIGFTGLALYTAAASVVRIAVAPLWGRALDRVGARTVLAACSFAIALVPLVWLFPAPGRLWPLAIDVVLAGVAWSGHGLAAFALPLSLASRTQRSSYLAAFAAAGGLAYAAAAAGAGWALASVPREVMVADRPVLSIHLLFLGSAALRLGAAGVSLRIFEARSRSIPHLIRLIARGMGRRLGRRALPLPPG